MTNASSPTDLTRAQSQHNTDGTDESEGTARQRLDRWLWFARAVKTRTLAAKLISEGKVRINRTRVTKPSQTVKPGDTVTAVLHGTARVLEVVDVGSRRGPATEAATLYIDKTPLDEPKDKAAKPAAVAKRERGAGRPTKRERRETDKLRSGS